MDKLSVNISYGRSIIRRRGVFGYVQRIGNKSYRIVLDSVLRKYPLLHDAVLYHEMAHIRYGSLSSSVTALRTGCWREWNYEQFGSVFNFIYEILEDNRIEFKLIREYPALVNVIALLNHAISITGRRKAAQQTSLVRLLRAVFLFVRCGQMELGVSPELYDYLWWRVMIARRSDDPLLVVKIANEITAFLYYLLWQDSVQGLRRFDVPGFYFRNKVGVLLQQSDDRLLDESVDSGLVKVMPWGGYQVSGRDLKKLVQYARRLIQMQYSAGRTVMQRVSGGVSVHDYGGIVHADRLALLGSYLEEYRDEYERIMRILSEAICNRSFVPGYDGVVNLRRQQEAYVDSFTLNGEKKSYLRVVKAAAGGDVLVIVDVSGSMYTAVDKAIAEAVVLVTALTRSGFRTAFCAVSDNIVICKGYDEYLGDQILVPVPGGSTNVHLVHKLLEMPDFNYRNEFKAMVFLTDGAWPIISNDENVWPGVVKIARLYFDGRFCTHLPQSFIRVSNLEEVARCIVRVAAK